MTPVQCIVQARTGSTRLPGKVLQDLGGRPMLRFMLDRLATIDDLVVATTTLDRDDPIVELARAAGRRVVRGSESDVLARFATALEGSTAEHVVRLTADCPLMDADLVHAVVDAHVRAGADYTSNVFPRTYPKGLDVEVVRAEVLRVADREAGDAAEREHVTPFVYRRPEVFHLANVRHDAWLGNEWWTVDTADDLQFVRALVEKMGNAKFSWLDALEVVGVRWVAPRGQVTLAPAGWEHCDFVLACRRDDDAVRWSRAGRAITPAEHAQWYTGAIDQPGVRLRIAYVDGAPVGTVRVDVAGGTGEVGIALAPERRGRGLGRALLDALVADCRADQQVSRLVARIHPENTASMRAFAAAGYVAQGEDDGFAVLGLPVHEPIGTV